MVGVKAGKAQLRAAFEALSDHLSPLSIRNLWELKDMPRSTARAALEELTRRGLLEKRPERTGRRGRPRALYSLLGHPDEARERFEGTMRQGRQREGDGEEGAVYIARTRMERLGKSKPEHDLGRALDIACADTGTTGLFDTFPKCPKRFGRPDYGSRRLKTALFADGSFWHGGEKYERTKHRLGEEMRARIEGTKRRDAQVVREWEAIGWKVLRFWEEELKDYRSIAAKLADEIWMRIEELREEDNTK